MIEFWTTRGEYGCFSNFSRHEVTIDGEVYQTSEHYYQAMKFTDPAIQKLIREAGTPKESKNLTYEHTELMRSDWDKVKFDVMRKVLRAKAKQHPIIMKKLMETGDEQIVEASPKDPIWGWGADKKGENWLGRLWMELREDLKKNATDQVSFD